MGGDEGKVLQLSEVGVVEEVENEQGKAEGEGGEERSTKCGLRCSGGGRPFLGMGDSSGEAQSALPSPSDTKQLKEEEKNSCYLMIVFVSLLHYNSLDVRHLFLSD